MPDVQQMSRVFSLTDGSNLIEVECRRHGLVLSTDSPDRAELCGLVHDRCLPKRASLDGPEISGFRPDTNPGCLS